MPVARFLKPYPTIYKACAQLFDVADEPTERYVRDSRKARVERPLVALEGFWVGRLSATGNIARHSKQGGFERKNAGRGTLVTSLGSLTWNPPIATCPSVDLQSSFFPHQRSGGVLK
jgi:hypothetical protein